MKDVDGEGTGCCCRGIPKEISIYKKMDGRGEEERRERKGSVVRGGGEVWHNRPRGSRPPNWYLNTRAEQNCCYHKKLMN